MKLKKFRNASGELMDYVSLDGLRYYPRIMVEDYAARYGRSVDEALSFLQTTSEASAAKPRVSEANV
jgi:hypothetical protein